jgi:DNA-binding FadR family transcriptional regulator
VTSDEILGGRFKVGERLPTERELAETLGVSRNVIREAIARLMFEGTVEPRQEWGFHRAVALASDNVYVAIFINFISEHVRASIAKANERVHLTSRQRINKEAAIYEAVAARDSEGARESMQRHISEAVGRLGLTKH